MNWSGWSDFLAMGGYAFYVWGAFGVTAAAMLAELGLLALRRRALTRNEGREAEAEIPHESQT
jgi:heme exporter protein D